MPSPASCFLKLGLMPQGSSSLSESPQVRYQLSYHMSLWWKEALAIEVLGLGGVGQDLGTKSVFQIMEIFLI